MPRSIEDPTLNDRGAEIHPAFGTAAISRSQGTPRSLFQSDLEHSHTINLTISAATRSRDLNYDSVHPAHELIEIEMSLAQWGALVSSMGVGSGVPVTIRRCATGRAEQTPEIPYQPRTAVSLEEVRTVTDKTFQKAREAFDALEEAMDNKQGIKVVRQKRSELRSAIHHAGSNAHFAVKSLMRATEKVVGQARIDVEAHMLQAARLTGSAPAQLPTMDVSFPDSEAIESTTDAEDNR